mmetsp:Transcript_22418/g.39731  ORF Transcript_22418/g.39731 Transcript_22418/m.39731 type:complete len:174 (+) Transcript_22418:339-860(+)
MAAMVRKKQVVVRVTCEDDLFKEDMFDEQEENEDDDDASDIDSFDSSNEAETLSPSSEKSTKDFPRKTSFGFLKQRARSMDGLWGRKFKSGQSPKEPTRSSNSSSKSTTSDSSRSSSKSRKKTKVVVSERERASLNRKSAKMLGLDLQGQVVDNGRSKRHFSLSRRTQSAYVL